MSFATATPAQRRKVRDEANKAMFAAQPFAQNAVTPTAAESTAVGTVLAGLATALSDVGITATLPATQAIVSNAQSVTVRNSAGDVTKTGTAAVAANAVTGVDLASSVALIANTDVVSVLTSVGASVSPAATASVVAGKMTFVALPATVTGVANAATVPVKNSAGTTVPGTSTATVSTGALQSVNLPATVAPVVNGVKINATSVTGTGNFATITVTNGVITAIVLSAS